MYVHWYSLWQIHCSYSGKAVFALYLIPGWMISQARAGKADGYAVPPSLSRVCVDWNTRRCAKFPVFKFLRLSSRVNWRQMKQRIQTSTTGLKITCNPPCTIQRRIVLLSMCHVYLYSHYVGIFVFLHPHFFFFIYFSTYVLCMYSLLLLYRAVALTYGRWRNDGLNRAGQSIINHD